MKYMFHSRSSTTLAATLAAALLGITSVSAQDTWSAGAGDSLWSSSGNWNSGTPDAFASVDFDLQGAVATTNTINNIVDTGFTSAISTLGYSSATTNGYHTTLISPGVTLSVQPQSSGANALSVGTWANNGGPPTPVTNDVGIQVVAYIVGTNGTLSINNNSSTIRIEQGAATTGTHFASLDM
jgi:hypothetical protein